MRRCAAARFVLAMLLAGCGADGAPQYGGGPPDPVATYGQCAFCHDALATHMTDTGGHGSLNIKCTLCHQDLTPGTVGPGHESVPACVDCHTDQETHHDPAVGTKRECVVCHTPHGSANIYLVDEAITVPGGAVRPVDFTNLDGRADGSFASASDPGTGLCEICHTTTRHYRSDGTGTPHFTLPCYPCHPHATGFSPR